MAGTSFTLGDHFSGFVAQQVNEGHYKNASDVMRAALRLLEEHEEKRRALRRAIQEGIDSGVDENFDFDDFLARKRAEHGAKA